LGRLFRVHGLFRRVGVALKVDSISVGVLKRGHPHRVPDERRLRRDPARLRFTVDGQSVTTDKADAYAGPQLPLRPAGVRMMVLSILLEHQRGLSDLKRAPFNLAVVPGRPLLGHRKAEPVHIEPQRGFHAGDHEEGDRLLDIRFGFGLRCHIRSPISKSLSRWLDCWLSSLLALSFWLDFCPCFHSQPLVHAASLTSLSLTNND